MATIIDKRGGLWKRVKINLRGEDEYELVENTPVLKYSKTIDCRFAITEDETIYDCHQLDLLKIEGKKFDTILDLSRNSLLAKEIDGSVYIIENVNGILNMTKFDGNWNFILLHIIADFLIINNTQRYGSVDDEEHESEIYSKVIEVVPNLMITPDRILFFDPSYTFEVMEFEVDIANMIGCGLIYEHKDAFIEEPRQCLVVIKEVDNQLITTYSEIKNDGIKEEEVYNGYLTNTHKQSPWIEMIYIGSEPYLLNVSGEIVGLRRDCSVITGKIPIEIFKPINMKSAQKN